MQLKLVRLEKKHQSFIHGLRKSKQECKRNLLKTIRTYVGLGNPPVRYTNNNNESYNSVLKREMEYKKQFLENMAVSLQNIIHRQYQELEKGVFNFGEYRLHNDYKHLSVSTLN